MDREIIQDFVKENNLTDIFGIKSTKQGEFIVIEIDSCISGFYDYNNKINIDKEIPFDLTEPIYEGMCKCVIFDKGNVVLCKEETWDGWQPDLVFYDFYKHNNKMPF